MFHFKEGYTPKSGIFLALVRYSVNFPMYNFHSNPEFLRSPSSLHMVNHTFLYCVMIAKVDLYKIWTI